jgi:hypothetical protein
LRHSLFSTNKKTLKISCLYMWICEWNDKWK